jgi:hypothetical protein
VKQKIYPKNSRGFGRDVIANLFRSDQRDRKVNITKTLNDSFIQNSHNKKLYEEFKKLMSLLLKIKKIANPENDVKSENNVKSENDTNTSCDPKYIQSHINEQVKLQIAKTIQELEKTQMETLKIKEIKTTLERISKEIVKPTNNKQLTYYIEDILNLLKKNNVHDAYSFKKTGGNKKKQKSQKSIRTSRTSRTSRTKKTKKTKRTKKSKKSKRTSRPKSK